VRSLCSNHVLLAHFRNAQLRTSYALLDIHMLLGWGPIIVHGRVMVHLDMGCTTSTGAQDKGDNDTCITLWCGPEATASVVPSAMKFSMLSGLVNSPCMRLRRSKIICAERFSDKLTAVSSCGSLELEDSCEQYSKDRSEGRCRETAFHPSATAAAGFRQIY
jgi:hypothetical protein